ncbi:MAG: metallophosphoesterase [Sphingomonadales bacterium]
MSTLFHVSDLHFGAEDVAALAAFAQAVRDERPDAVVMTGDLTMRARAHEFAAAEEWLTSLGVPVTIGVGNHDLPHYYKLWSRFFRPYARFERLERAIERPLELADVAIVPLKTTARAQWRLNWSQGRVATRRLSATLKGLNAVPDARIRIVTCHHPLLDAPGGQSAGRTRGGHASLAALAAAGTDIVLSGHVHDAFDIVWNDGSRPVRMVGAGTLSERVRATRPSYNRIDIDGSNARVTLRELL